MLYHVRSASSHDTGDHHRENAVREVLATRETLDQRPAEEKADGHAGAVGAKVEKADVDQVREHFETTHLNAATAAKPTPT